MSPPPRIGDASLVLVDTSPIVNFCAVGCRLPFVEHLGDRARITADVERELVRKAVGNAALKELLRGWPPVGALALEPDLQAKALMIMDAMRPVGGHPLENAGEVTTVLLGETLSDASRGRLLLLMDDGDGRRLARARGLRTLSTRGLVVEMVTADKLNERVGERVWREASQPWQWPEYWTQLTKVRGT